jgi:hypothetical protein
MTDSRNGLTLVPGPESWEGEVVPLRGDVDSMSLADSSEDKAPIPEIRVLNLDEIRKTIEAIRNGKKVEIGEAPKPRPKLRVVEDSANPAVEAARSEVEASGPELAQFLLEEIRGKDPDDLPPAA